MHQQQEESSSRGKAEGIWIRYRSRTISIGRHTVVIALLVCLYVALAGCENISPFFSFKAPGTPTKKFTTLPPGSPLPSERECTSRIRYSSFEPRPDNYTANHQVPTAQQIANLAPWDASISLNPKADSLRQHITGNFTGTTDEILQWVACKWGIDEDIVRAQAVAESTWYQSNAGDYTSDQSLCPPGTWNGSGCYQSYGILQIKYIYSASSWPMSRDDTAFSAEYAYGIIRTCYEGWANYLSQRTPMPGYHAYQAGDIWGCVGRWFSGSWYDQAAIDYINKVQIDYASKDWLEPGF